MKKKLVVTLAATVLAFSLVACGKTEEATTEAETTEAVTEAETTEEETTEEATADVASAEDASNNDALMEYISEDGWSVKYDGELVEASDIDNGAQFVYVGESAGTNMLSITYDPEG